MLTNGPQGSQNQMDPTHEKAKFRGPPGCTPKDPTHLAPPQDPTLLQALLTNGPQDPQNPMDPTHE